MRPGQTGRQDVQLIAEVAKLTGLPLLAWLSYSQYSIISNVLKNKSSIFSYQMQSPYHMKNKKYGEKIRLDSYKYCIIKKIGPNTYKSPYLIEY